MKSRSTWRWFGVPCLIAAATWSQTDVAADKPAESSSLPSPVSGRVAGGEGVTVLVAASAKDALAEIAAAFEKETGIKVVLSPGRSNALANQIIKQIP